jgi:hypothetical protein
MIFRRSILIYVCFVGTMLACAAQASGQGFSSDEWYVSWGYNRSAYTTSDVKMWGTGPSGEAFDVTLQDARANDMPERFQAKVYFHPGLFTIPQFNARFGKRIAPNWWVSAGWDHMKYKLQKQHVVADGYAGAADWENDDTLPPGTISEWSGDSLWWGEGFNLEHSDGMNFVRFSLEHQTDVWRSVNDQFMLSVFEAVGAGVVVCSTDFTWAGERQKNAQHLSGLGIGVHAGLRMQLHRRFFIQATGHAGAVTLPWIRLQGPTDAGAKQSLGYVEAAFALGYLIGGDHKPKGKRNCNTCPKW